MTTDPITAGSTAEHPPHRPVARFTCWLAYLTAFTIALAVTHILERTSWLDGYLLKGLCIDIIATVVLYLFSFFSDNSSVYDPYWCLAPLFLGFYWKAHAPGGFFFFEPRETICIVYLWLWASRFSIALPWDGWLTGLHIEDWRFELIRTRIPWTPIYWMFSFSSFHLTPTLLVFFALCPVGRVILQGTQSPPLNYLDAVGVLVTAGGIVVEAVADEQLRRFRLGYESSTKSLHSGLWRWSRHPNYFGECTFWTGLMIIGGAAGVIQAEPILLLGTVVMWIFFRFASVPMMDERLASRRPDYMQVMATTSALLLWPPAKSRVD